jgi:hypothetical protein
VIARSHWFGGLHDGLAQLPAHRARWARRKRRRRASGRLSAYEISYRSIVPRESECENLLVPVCLSASHIAYGSIRMEPVFMVLGQSSAIAAGMALDEKVAVQKISYKSLRIRLLSAGQILEWASQSTSSKGHI